MTLCFEFAINTIRFEKNNKQKHGLLRFIEIAVTKKCLLIVSMILTIACNEHNLPLLYLRKRTIVQEFRDQFSWYKSINEVDLHLFCFKIIISSDLMRVNSSILAIDRD